MRVGRICVIGCVAAACLWAAEVPDRLADLKSKAEKHDPADRGRSYSEIANYLTDVARNQFNAGDSEKAQATLKEMIYYVRKAADSAKMKKKGIKETELSLREVDLRLDGLSHALLSEDREAIKPMTAEIRQIRKELRDVMFAKKK